MASIDPQIFFNHGYEAYLNSSAYLPRNVDVLEIYQFEVERSSFILNTTPSD